MKSKRRQKVIGKRRIAENIGVPVDLLNKLATQPDRAGGYHFNPLNLLALKTLLKHYPDEAIPILDRCINESQYF